MIHPDMQSITLVYRQSVTHTDNASASCGSGRSTTLPTNSYQLSNLTDHISFDVGNANAKRVNVKTCENFLKTEYECDTWFRRTEDAFYNSRWSTKSVNNINQSIVFVFFSVNFPSLVWTLIKLNSLNLLYVQYRIRILEPWLSAACSNHVSISDHFQDITICSEYWLFATILLARPCTTSYLSIKSSYLTCGILR